MNDKPETIQLWEPPRYPGSSPNALPSGLHVLCPDRKIRKVSQIQVTPPTAGMDTLGLSPCAIRLSGFHVKGWRDKQGNFIPHSASKGFQMLVEWAGVGPEWATAARDDISIHSEARIVWAKTHDAEPVCQDPYVWNEYYPDTPENRAAVNSLYEAIEIEPGVFVHVRFSGQREWNILVPVPSCPNASLWDKEAGYALPIRPPS